MTTWRECDGREIKVLMCGIVGLLEKSGNIDGDQLRTMTLALTHRGPDDHQLWFDSGVGLGHCMLRITGKCQQPFQTNCGLILVFNGEIYNYREIRNELIDLGVKFTTDSDTEVVAYSWSLWGRDSARRFNGIFAFAVYDTVRNQLYLVRDRWGTKPLYWFERNGTIAFASELGALRKHRNCPREVSIEALNCYLALQYIPAPLSAFTGLFKVPQDTCIEFHLDRHRINEHRIHGDESLKPSEIDTVQGADYVRRLDATLRRAINRQKPETMDYGLLLSGGVDSSALLRASSRSSPKVAKSFTASFEDSAYDEGSWGTSASRLCCVKNQLVEISQDNFEIVDELLVLCGEPLGDWALVPTYALCKAVRDSGLRVALSGEGADELFLGYDRYRSLIGEPIGHLDWLGVISILGFKERAKLWRCELQGAEHWLNNWSRSLFERFGHLERSHLLRAVDVFGYLSGAVLHKADLASMAASVELRVPYLDDDVWELARSLPTNEMLKPMKGALENKAVLRGVLRLHGMHRFASREKQGFTRMALP